MRCPLDQTELKIAERQGVEIDYCPQCRGVWLDRGELDKILDRASSAIPPAAGAATERMERVDRGDDRREPDYPAGGYGSPPHRRRKRSFLDDIFDFD